MGFTFQLFLRLFRLVLFGGWWALLLLFILLQVISGQAMPTLRRRSRRDPLRGALNYIVITHKIERTVSKEPQIEPY